MEAPWKHDRPLVELLNAKRHVSNCQAVAVEVGGARGVCVIVKNEPL